jgi:uncharacterized protein YcbK (DUF882 family)
MSGRLPAGATSLNRRRFIALSFATAAAIAAPVMPAWCLSPTNTSRRLSFVHTHTAESLLSVTYFENGNYVADALAKFNHLLRDFRNEAARPIDPGLFDILFDLQTLADRDAPFEILSGYRSPETNRMLRARSKGVAAHSLHMEGQAIDVRLSGCSCKKLQKLAIGMQRGGVGYYGASNFIHVDTGSVRAW